jgi:molybdopterin synthase catalytic subunit
MGAVIDIAEMMDRIRRHPDFHQAGMVLCHNGVVRATQRDGRPVSGLSVRVDHERLEEILTLQRSRPGIIDIQVEIVENRFLAVGEDIMLLAVAGDVRERVIAVLSDTLDAIKAEATEKIEEPPPKSPGCAR